MDTFDFTSAELKAFERSIQSDMSRLVTFRRLPEASGPKNGHFPLCRDDPPAMVTWTVCRLRGNREPIGKQR